MQASYSDEQKKDGQCQFILLIEMYEESPEDRFSKMLAESLAREIDNGIMSRLIDMARGTSAVYTLDDEQA